MMTSLLVFLHNHKKKGTNSKKTSHKVLYVVFPLQGGGVPKEPDNPEWLQDEDAKDAMFTLVQHAGTPKQLLGGRSEGDTP